MFTKLLPYLVVIGLIAGCFYYGYSLYNENLELTKEKTKYEEVIKENKKTIEDLQKDFNTANNELETLRKNEADAKQYLDNPELQVKIDNLVNETDTNKLLDNINKYQACLVKQFENPNINCLGE